MAMVIFLECGRKFGKTEIVCYFLWRLALTRPGGYYYLAPEQKQAREILWAPKRILTFGPQEYIAGVNNTEMRITFINGSFIKVDGSDNYDSYRGIEPHGIAYDEFRNFRPEFHAAMGPNLGVHSAPLLITTTPPERDLEHYDSLLNECKASGDYFHGTTFDNPHVSREFYEKEKEKLYARGEADVWERENMARRVRGGKKSIFPMFAERHVMRDEILAMMINKDRHKMDWFVVADPGTTSCFAVIFGAVHRYTKCVYIIREIYEKRQSETSTSLIVPRVSKLKEEAYPGYIARGIEFDHVYDEAAAWFATEALNSFGESEDHADSAVWTPTNKSLRDKLSGLSAIKDAMNYGLFVVSDACPNVSWEIVNYLKDDHNKPIKENDHLIDCIRYAFDFHKIGFAQESEAKPTTEARRGYRIEDDFPDDDDDLGGYD